MQMKTAKWLPAYQRNQRLAKAIISCHNGNGEAWPAQQARTLAKNIMANMATSIMVMAASAKMHGEEIRRRSSGENGVAARWRIVARRRRNEAAWRERKHQSAAAAACLMAKS